MFKQENIDQLIMDFNLELKLINYVVWINLDCVESKLFIDKKYKNLIDYNDENHIRVIGKRYYISEHKLIEYIKQLKSHPEHYNAHKILGINSKFHKRDEIEILASIYNHYRSEYNMHYQHPELEFKIDTNIVIETGVTGGLAIEIDESNHSSYKKKDHEDRQKILEATLFYSRAKK
ncbi:hypothetical protein QLL95_gp0517 [Cotonvirus japonicus]|uniref:Uncharacterized protein n=1 Tax=Cotonvirus japonicus TaxID=2811091 RepID=A0ABN6ED96_9VIRU|nr:hypothetical protein QLL95_gp0517 [Cotonvirus japonicus]BCS83606.1 hypothetical protein [Cotonvirus japonicus]